MRILIDSSLHLHDVPTDFGRWLIAELTMDNPEFTKKQAMGIPTWGLDRKLKEYALSTDTDGCVYSVPRGFAKNIQDHLAEVAPFPVEWIDNRVISPVEYSVHPLLRPYQSPVLDISEMYSQGVCIAPCGAGKTQMALGVAAKLGQRTLWITHTMDLLQQSMDRAISCLGLGGAEIGLIQAENMKIGTHITFATVQTLARRDLKELAKLFGTIIVDECHLVYKNGIAARQFADVVAQLPSMFRFGFTASEFRADGLIETMFHVMGPKFYEVSQSALDAAGFVVHPEVDFRETDFQYTPPEDETLNCQQMLVAMREDDARNNVIHQAIRECVGEPTLILSDSLDHLEELMAWTVRTTGTPCGYINGSTKKVTRAKILNDMREGRLSMLFASYQLAKLGLDIPRLSRLILATPKRDKTSIQQAAGRIMRPDPGKAKPIVYDIYDHQVKTLTYWARERVRVYHTLGAEITGGPRTRKAVAK